MYKLLGGSGGPVNNIAKLFDVTEITMAIIMIIIIKTHNRSKTHANQQLSISLRKTSLHTYCNSSRELNCLV